MTVGTYSRKLGKRVVRLHITISFAFLILTLPVMITFLVISYKANTALIADHSEKFILDSVNENIGNATTLFNPFVNAARSAATLMRDQTDYFHKESSAEYLHEIVASNDSVYAAYAAFDDGSFRQVRRTSKDGTVLGKPIPTDTQFISRYKARNGTTALNDRYTFFSDWDKKIGETSGAATYDPTTRNYYKDSVNFKEATISDPYIFASSGELGITVAAPALANGHTIGVIGVDLTLKTLSEFLSNHRVTPNSVTIIADEFGGVVAHPQFELGLTKKGDEIIQNRLEKLNDYRVLGALAERLRTKQDRVVFHAGADNAEYLAIFSPFPKNFKKPWELLIITPTNDFIGELKRTNRYLMTFGLIALLVQLLLINRLARAISRPMELLESDVANIREFRFDKLNNVQSSVTEVKYLSESIYLLARALESFTSYVPRGLVRKLVESGMGTKLGVESRYLTMFFTDLEGFSSLAETEPSQLLLQRISDYFSTVTKAIERESGTVDKFIGDAVMAFWGAPLRHDQHAYAACVAAVRSQRGLAHLNAAWAKENLPPLKLRIGIHSDAVLVGNIGSVERISYTVMGDGVNVAARLEGINKEMGTWTCVSHNVFREAGERLWLRPIDTVTVKGRKGELLIYELLAIRDGDAEVAATQDEIALCELTIAAYAEYANGNWENAISAYTKVLDQYPHDPVAQRMLEKSRARIIKTAA